MSGDHCVVSQTMSLELCIAAHGCLRRCHRWIVSHVSSRCTIVASPNAPAKEYDDGITLGGDEPEQEDILRAARVALWRRLAQGALGVQRHLLVLGSHEVVDNVGP